MNFYGEIRNIIPEISYIIKCSSLIHPLHKVIFYLDWLICRVNMVIQ